MRDLYIRWMELMEPVPGDSYLARLPVVKHLAERKIEFSGYGSLQDNRAVPAEPGKRC